MAITIQKAEQAVLINFNRLNDISDLHIIEKELQTIIEKNNLGEFDHHSVARDLSHGTIYMYGESADKIFNAIENTVRESKILKGAKVIVRYGSQDDETPRKTIDL